MKQKYFLIGLFFLIFNHSYSAYYFQVSGVEPLTGGQSYLVNQSSNPLGLSILVCAFGNTQPSYATTYTLTWYKNTVNSTVGGVMVSQSNLMTVDEYNITDIKTYLPDTSQAGTFYYYAVLSNPQYTTCGFTTTLTSTTQTVNIYNAATHLNFVAANNDRVELPNESLYDFTNQMTVELWMNSNVTPYQWDPLIAKGDNSWRLHLNDNGTLAFSCNVESTTTGTNAVSTTIITDGSWHHVAGTFDGTFVKIYIDGILESQTAAAGNLNNSSFPVFIGRNPDYLQRFFTGSIEDVRIWNAVRTAEQINGSKNCELQGTETGLVSYYKFNQGNAAANNSTETIAIDATGTNNGTLLGFTLTGTTSNWLAGSPVTTGSMIPSAATVTTPVVYVQGDTATALTATAGTNGTGLIWYTTATGGTGTTAPTPSTAAVGSTSYWVSSINANGCESERAEIVVKVNALATHLNFDGVNDFVQVPSGINIANSSFTVEFYAKRSLSNTNDYVFNQGFFLSNYNLHIGFRDNDNFLFAFYNNDLNISSANYVSDNEWHYWSCVYNVTDGSRVVYQDGILVGSQTTGVAPYEGSGSVQIGSQNSNQHFFDGNLDDIRIWNVARTVEQINSSKNCELQGNESGLLAYYKFNQGFSSADNTSITTLTDATVNANNGALTNFALTGATSNWLAGSLVGIPSVITLQPQDETVSETDPLTFTVNATGVNAYQWEVSFDGGTTWQNLEDTFTNPDVSGSTTNTVTISGSNMIGINGYKFRVILDGTLMCSIMSNEVLATVTLAVKSFGSNTVKVYPNPSTGIFTIDTQEEVEFAVYDVVGKTIVTQKSLIGSNNLDLSRFQKGIYLLKLMNSNGETNTYKLIKE